MEFIKIFRNYGKQILKKFVEKFVNTFGIRLLDPHQSHPSRDTQMKNI